MYIQKHFIVKWLPVASLTKLKITRNIPKNPKIQKYQLIIT